MSAIVTEKRAAKAPRKAVPGGAVISAILRYGVLILLSILFLIPFYLLIRNGLATEQEITAFDWKLFPGALHFENIPEIFNDDSAPFLHGLMNSAIIAVLTTVGSILFSALAGYGLARIPYRHANIVFGAILVTLMIPGAVTFVPTYIIVSYLGWVSTLQGLIVPGLFSGFTTFLFRQFFMNFPYELEEAGRVDGLGYWGLFWRIVVPNSKPIIAALSVTAFIGSWNSFLWPLVVGQDESSWTAQVVLSTFQTAQTIVIHEIFIGALITIVPLVVIFFFLQRYIVEGYTQTGLKG